ncbi:MAG TPA: TolC family protein [Candidatus Saccharimonadales bacterium]|nr:TolC family protein [Candidatus Saccharimonadales bacterium]
MKLRCAGLILIALTNTQTILRAQTPPATAAAGTPGSRPLTLREAEAIALQRNPNITLGKLRALQAREFVREARSAYYPNANLNLTAVESDPGSRISAGYLNNPVIYPRAAYGASLTQLVTDFGRTNNLVESSRHLEKAEAQNAIATQQDIILAVDEAFYNTLETRALQVVAEQTVKARQDRVDQVQALTNAKLKSEVDLSFSNVDLARARLLLLDSQNNYQSSLATLSAILGYTEQQDFVPVDGAEPITPPATDSVPLVQQALQQRPEVKALHEEVTAATRFSKAEHDLWWPTVNAAGAVGQAPVRNDNISSWYGAVGVNINIPVFNGFLYNARAKSADLQTQIKESQLRALEERVARDVRNSWLESQKAYERLTVTQQLEDQASKALELAEARYKLGLGSIVEYSQAELQKTDADLQDADAHYQYLLSQIELAYQMGTPR